MEWPVRRAVKKMVSTLESTVSPLLASVRQPNRSAGARRLWQFQGSLWTPTIVMHFLARAWRETAVRRFSVVPSSTPVWSARPMKCDQGTRTTGFVDRLK